MVGLPDTPPTPCTHTQVASKGRGSTHCHSQRRQPRPAHSPPRSLSWEPSGSSLGCEEHWRLSPTARGRRMEDVRTLASSDHTPPVREWLVFNVYLTLKVTSGWNTSASNKPRPELAAMLRNSSALIPLPFLNFTGTIVWREKNKRERVIKTV